MGARHLFLYVYSEKTDYFYYCFITLELCTFVHVSMSFMLSFYQYKIHKWSQILHTRPLHSERDEATNQLQGWWEGFRTCRGSQKLAWQLMEFNHCLTGRETIETITKTLKERKKKKRLGQQWDELSSFYQMNQTFLPPVEPIAEQQLRCRQIYLFVPGFQVTWKYHPGRTELLLLEHSQYVGGSKAHGGSA